MSPGRNPLVGQVAPPSVEVAKPMSEPPPSKNRPTWNAVTTVEPLENVSGSTSVACWLVVFLNGSVLIRVSATLAEADAAKVSVGEGAEQRPDRHAAVEALRGDFHARTLMPRG